MVSPASAPAFPAGAAAERFGAVIVAVAGGGVAGATRRGFLSSTGGALPAAGRAARGFFGSPAVLRGGPAAALTRTGSGLRPPALLTAGPAARFFPFARLGAGLFGGLHGSSKNH